MKIKYPNVKMCITQLKSCERKSVIACYVIYGILCVFFYFLTKGFMFIGDDYEILISSLNHPFPVFSDWVEKAQTMYRSIASQGMYRPLVILSFYINYLLGGYYPSNFYLFNLLIHLANTMLFSTLIKDFFELFTKDKNKILLHTSVAGLIFFILPQNMMNLFWISGRTDLICGFFILCSSMFLIKYVTQHGRKYLFLALAFTIFSYLSKETAVLSNLYALIIILVFSRKQKKKYYYILSYYIAITFLYSLLRLFIFDVSIVKYVQHNTWNIFEAGKFILYGGWALFIPLDILDLVYMINKGYQLLVLMILLPIISFLCLFFYNLFRIKNKSEKTSVMLIIIISILSLLLYIGNYPQMRLMYVHIPLLLLGGTLLFYFSDMKIILKKILISFYMFIIIVGGLIEIHRTVTINEYYQKIWEVLPTNSQIANGDIFIFAGILNRIGQSQVAPPLDIMSDIKENKPINSISKNIFKILDYETADFLPILPDFSVKKTSDSTICFSSRSNNFVFVPSNMNKFSCNPMSITTGEHSFNLEALKFIDYMDKKATEVALSYEKNFKWDKVKIIYWTDNIFQISRFRNFTSCFFTYKLDFEKL